MKKVILLFTLVVFIFYNLQGQKVQLQDEIKIEDASNNSAKPCITPEQYIDLEDRCIANSKFLMKGVTTPVINSSSLVSMDWPLRASSNLHDCSYYNVSAYVDQDTITGSIRDFNCGSNTYDGHRGTDISIWPFNFYKMDNDLVEVVAAAAGIILDKHDGEFDRNCTSNNLTANYVIIEHGDGSRALYWHMKNGSVTLKAIGQPVIAGEYLGVVGSSGSSSGPHLHFEVWSGNNNSTRRDPYAGSCNSLNVQSWWNSQKSYKETGITRATVHTTDAVVPGCPTTETLNESSIFQVPFQGPGLPAGYAKFYIFIRDEISGMTGTMSILNPNGSVYQSWTYTSTTNSKTKMWGWSKVLPTIPGTYAFTATYNGVTCTSDFEIVSATGINDPDRYSNVRIYSNPSSEKIIFEFDDNHEKTVEIFNCLGSSVYRFITDGIKSEIDFYGPDGIYIYKVTGQSNKVYSGKFIIMN